MQKRNTYTQIEDFLSDDSFRFWILSKIDNDGWEEWTLESLQRAKLVEDARLLLLAMKVPENEFSASEIHKALQNTWIKIREKENQKTVQIFKINIFRKHFLSGIAATLFLCMASAWLYSTYFKSANSVVTYNELINDYSEGLVEQTNNSSKPQIITLSDGSSVLLQPNSRLSYPKIFDGNERKVYLSGEAFFEISKNPKKPFFVFANEIVTKVVGTSFRVKAYSDKPDVEVLVRTGKVKVKSNNLAAKSDNNEIILLPNQALRFQRSEMKFNKITDITQDAGLSKSIGSIEQLSFEFTDIPVSQIFETIEQAYLIDIDFPKDKLKDCHLTTSLSDQPLTEKLKIICKSIGNNTSFEMNGNQITIISEGCN